MVYRSINQAGCWQNTRRICKSRAAGEWFTNGPFARPGHIVQNYIYWWAIAQWDFQNNAPAFVLEVPLCNFLTSIYNFVPCDRVMQKGLFFKCSANILSGLSAYKP